ncbi:hypothetical protein [Streptomyces fuscigenes]|uniref:hypothetical protein n=1 Tax=Streptomyces fuscigenes TaxID=1528880 RepID=UPI001F41AB01|nr:hypothetical protein [Streptomyces fuscigenes]MCF3965121.1 hypothetical protein [Streptomyces fuscigenes]
MPYICFFAALGVAALVLLVRTQRQLGRSRSLVPEVHASVGASEGALRVRRAMLVVCLLAALGGLPASLHVHDLDTWTDGEVLGIAKDAADEISGGDGAASPAMSVNAAVDEAQRHADGPGLLTTRAVGSDGDGGAPPAYGDEDDTSYVISYHGEHAACLTVTSTPGAPVLVPGGGDGEATRMETYDLSATASAGAC